MTSISPDPTVSAGFPTAGIDPPWYLCAVLQAGADENQSINICLMPAGTDTPRWFAAVDAMKREMLATALAAITSGYNVYALPTLGANPQVQRMYLAAPGA